jgi:hypothetical protein
MIDALIGGKLIKDPSKKMGPSGNYYAQFAMGVHIGDEPSIVVSGIAFGVVAEKILLLKKGDALSVIGPLKPTEWIDKTTNETRHGLSVTVNNVLSLYEIKKRKPKFTTAAVKSKNELDFDDELTF